MQISPPQGLPNDSEDAKSRYKQHGKCLTIFVTFGHDIFPWIYFQGWKEEHYFGCVDFAAAGILHCKWSLLKLNFGGVIFRSYGFCVWNLDFGVRLHSKLHLRHVSGILSSELHPWVCGKSGHTCDLLWVETDPMQFLGCLCLLSVRPSTPNLSTWFGPCFLKIPRHNGSPF